MRKTNEEEMYYYCISHFLSISFAWPFVFQHIFDHIKHKKEGPLINETRAHAFQWTGLRQSIVEISAKSKLTKEKTPSDKRAILNGYYTHPFECFSTAYNAPEALNFERLLSQHQNCR